MLGLVSFGFIVSPGNSPSRGPSPLILHRYHTLPRPHRQALFPLPGPARAFFSFFPWTQGRSPIIIINMINIDTNSRDRELEGQSHWLERLDDYVDLFRDDFRRRDQIRWASVYLQGLLLEGQTKTIGAMARRVLLPPDLVVEDVSQALQNFVNQSPWDERKLWRRHRQLARHQHGAAGVFVLDDLVFVKNGRHSVGVQRQFSGRLGARRIARSRSGSFMWVERAAVCWACACICRATGCETLTAWMRPACPRNIACPRHAAASPWICWMRPAPTVGWRKRFLSVPVWKMTPACARAWSSVVCVPGPRRRFQVHRTATSRR